MSETGETAALIMAASTTPAVAETPKLARADGQGKWSCTELLLLWPRLTGEARRRLLRAGQQVLWARCSPNHHDRALLLPVLHAQDLDIKWLRT